MGSHSQLKKVAFTLSEVLITLTILGIVAAITVPSINSYFKKAYTISRLKQAYSLVVNAIQMAETESRINSDSWDYTYNNSPSPEVNNLFFSQFNIAADCRIDANASIKCIGVSGKSLKDSGLEGNWYDGSGSGAWGIARGGYTYIKDANGNYTSYNWLNNNAVILKNGMSLALFGNGYYKYVQIFIDIDGPNKGASQLNKDIFPLYLTGSLADTIDKNPRFNPYITTSYKYKTIDYNTAKSKCINGGLTCFAYIIKSGWKIPADYPVKF